MFYHRESELRDISSLLAKSGKAMMIYGKRRVGKTALALEATAGMERVYYECVKDTLENNAAAFRMACIDAGIAVPDFVSFNSFADAFSYLGSLGRRIVVIIDEYPFLGHLNDPATVDSQFQSIIDRGLGQLNLILSGSAVKTMEETLKEGNPLYGRFAMTLFLKEFNYLEASSFYPDLMPWEKIRFYAVFGGSPFVNSLLDPNASLKENVVANYLKVGSAVSNYASNTAIADVSSPAQARRILAFLGNSRKKHSAIMGALDPEKSGVLARPLNSLLELKAIAKVAPINKKGDPKKASYEITDNAVRFYNTYVRGHESQLAVLGPGRFYDECVAPTIEAYIDRRLEEIAREYFSIAVRRGLYQGVRDIGTYYYDDPVEKRNGEFDVALEYADGYGIVEVKRHNASLSDADMLAEIKQIQSIAGIKVKGYGFISASGFENAEHDFLTLDANDLYAI